MRNTRYFCQILVTVMLLLRLGEAYGDSPAEADSLAINFENSSDFERQILDAPDLIAESLRQRLVHMEVSRDFDKLLKIYIFFGWEATLNQHQSPEQINLMLSAIKLRKLYLEYSLIKSGLVFEQTASAPNGIPTFDDLIKEISSFHDPQSLAYAQTMYAYHLLGIRQKNEAFAKIVEAKKILDDIKDPSLLVKVQVESAFGDALNESQKFDATLAARTELDQLLDRLGIRSRRAFNLYNTGIFYCKRNQPGDLSKAQDIFQESIQLAQSVKAANIEALAHFGMSTLASTLNRFEEAIVHGNKALEYYDSGGPDDGWRPRILKLLAKAYLGAGNHAESLRSIERAEKLMPKTNISGLNELTRLRFLNAKKQFQWQKATELSEKYLEAFSLLAQEKEKQQYQKSAVDLGLKFEEERSSHLKQQVELLQKFRWMTFFALLLLVVSLAALAMVIRQHKSLQKSRTLMNKAHDQIADQHKEMQLFIDEIPGSLVSFDQNLNVLAENICYKTLRLSGDHDLLKAVNEKVEQFQRENRDFVLVRLDFSTNTTVRSYDVSLKRYTNRSKTCTLLLMTDVSVRVELENALEMERIRGINSAKLVGLGELAGGIAHEINNPLAIIGGRAEQIEKIITQIDATLPLQNNIQYALKSAKSIQDTVTRISRIIIQLRNFARDSSFDSPEYCAIGPIIEDTMLLMNEKMQKNGLELIIENDASEVRTQLVRQQLIQVFSILIQNAMEASIESAMKKIVVRIQLKDQDTLQISISDFGRGVKESGKVFLAFYTTKEIGEGIGLGLSTAYGIIKSHGGTIYLASNQNPTTFTIEMPIRAESSFASAS